MGVGRHKVWTEIWMPVDCMVQTVVRVSVKSTLDCGTKAGMICNVRQVVVMMVAMFGRLAVAPTTCLGKRKWYASSLWPHTRKLCGLMYCGVHPSR